MLNALHGVMLNAHTYTSGETLCSMLYKGESYMIIAKHGLKLCAHCYTWSEILCFSYPWNEALCS